MIDAIIEQLRDYWASVGAVLPRVSAAILVLFLGWVLAALLRRMSVRILRKARVDVLAERAGIEGFLVQGGVRFTAVSLIAWAVYWLVILATISLALSISGMEVADEMMRRIVLYIPNVVVAVLIVGFGALFARFVRGALETYLNNVGVEGARPISAIAQYAIVVFVATIALEQLQIGGETLTTAFKMAFGALCLAFGLAFGLGGRRWAAAILDRIWKP